MLRYELMKRILITAGPTHEAIDEVRYIANRSSGRMGIALAEAAHRAGWQVTLLLGPTYLRPSAEIQTHSFVSTADLQNLLREHFPLCNVLIMAAAVADFRPQSQSAAKIERTTAGFNIMLEPTPDLVAECATRKRQDQMVLGFALEEPAKLELRAVDKLRRKNLDAIVANPLSTIGGEKICPAVFDKSGSRVNIPSGSASPISKGAFAEALIRWIESTYRQ